MAYNYWHCEYELREGQFMDVKQLVNQTVECVVMSVILCCVSSAGGGGSAGLHSESRASVLK